MIPCDISESSLAFAQEHLGDDPLQLLLQRQRYPDVDMELVARQIEGHRQAAMKWPLLLEYPGYLYPPHLGREQSSSQATALYKASLTARLLADEPAPRLLLDLTGGMGIDDLFFARSGMAVDYIERDAELCRLAQRNFATLGADTISCHCADCESWTTDKSYHVVYADPARRDAAGRKTSAFADCSPDITVLMHKLPPHRYLLIKASPMADIALCTEQLERNAPSRTVAVTEVHVVAVGGECKELLFWVAACDDAAPRPTIICTNLRADGSAISTHRFSAAEERASQPHYCTQGVLRYLYEPHAALMKAAPWGCICKWYDVLKLDRNSHLYTSDRLVDDFPGRTFEILQEVPLNKKEVARALAALGSQGRANVFVQQEQGELTHTAAARKRLMKLNVFVQQEQGELAHTAAARKRLMKLNVSVQQEQCELAHIAAARKRLMKLNVISRNHPLSANSITHTMHLTPGGNLYLIATTVLGKPKCYIARNQNSAE